MFHRKTKHFNIKLYFLRKMQKNREVTLVYCKSEDQLANLFRKPLLVSKLKLLRQKKIEFVIPKARMSVENCFKTAIKSILFFILLASDILFLANKVVLVFRRC
jgi:hypothetical protein